MITLKAMPFDSNEILDPATGETYFDRVAYSRDLADWLGTYFSNGILIQGGGVIGNQLKVTHTSSLNLAVATGALVINGRTGWLEQEASLTVDMGEAQPRIDRVVAELNLPNDRGIYIKVLKGVAAASPKPPDLTQTDDVYQLSLAQVRVNANQAVIGTVTDERAGVFCGLSNVTVGIEHGLPTASTSVLGGVKVGNYLTMANGVLNVNSNGLAPVVGPKIVTGSYVGDGTANRTISVGFMPRVFILIGGKYSMNTTTFGYFGTGRPEELSITSGGALLSGHVDNVNAIGYTHYYAAFA